MSDITISFLVLGAVVVLFVSNLIPVELVAIGSALALYATGVLTLNQSLAGFGDPTVVLIASLFVVSEGLDSTGTTAWAGQQLLSRAGDGRPRLLIMMMSLVAGLTALISVNGAVAALVPMVVVMAIRLDERPSQLLMPLAFAAHAGSMLALTGTPVNVLVSEAANDAGLGEFGFFSFALVGIPLLLGTIAIVVLFGERLLPNRKPSSISPDLSEHARTLRQQYLADHTVFRLRILAGSAFIGHTVHDIDVTGYAGISLVGVQRDGRGRPTLEAINQGDVLIVRGELEPVEALCAARNLEFRSDPFLVDASGQLLDRVSGVAELVVPPRSSLVGTRIFPGMVTESGDLVVLAIQRKGQDLGARETIIAVGDNLLVRGAWDALEKNEASPDVLSVDSPELIRRQALPLGPGAKRAIGVLIAMVVLLATGLVPAVVASLLAAAAMVLLRVVNMEQCYRSISWTSVILVGGMIPLSVAIKETGAAEKIAIALVDLVGDSGPYALLVGIFVLTVTLGQLISNTATALILIPIAVSAASQLDISAKPVLMTVTVSAAASFLTPVATPANMMVMGPGGYKFGDYWKLGLPLVLWYLLVVTLLIPLIWSF